VRRAWGGGLGKLLLCCSAALGEGGSGGGLIYCDSSGAPLVMAICPHMFSDIFSLLMTCRQFIVNLPLIEVFNSPKFTVTGPSTDMCPGDTDQFADLYLFTTLSNV
jgi:hypothetical protein